MGLRLDSGNAVRWDHSLNRGLVSWWLALPDQQRGVMFRDLCLRNHGTLTGGPTWQGARGRPGGWGTVLLDNSDDYVACGSNSFFANSATPATFAWWEYVVSGSGNFPSRFRVVVTGESNDWAIIRGNFTNYDRLVCGGGVRHNFGGVQFAGAPTLASMAGVWSHWCLVASVGLDTTTPSNFELYVNGVSYAPTASGGFGVNGVVGNRLGYDGADSAANCYLDDVRIWNRALSASEAVVLYQESRQGYHGLLNWHRPWYYVAQEVGGVTGSPWYLYQRLMAG